MRRCPIAALLLCLACQSIAVGQSDTASLFTFEIPEMGVRLNGGASVALPGGNPTHVQVRIALQPTQVAYGNVFSRINTESANVVMTVTGTATGVLCDFDLTRREGFRFRAGRNSVEVAVQDNRGRLRYASFLIELSGAASEAARTAAPVSVVAGDRYAIIVGISRYRAAAAGFKNLAFAGRDAAAMRDFLESPEGGGYRADHVELLLDEDATLERLKGALGRIASRATAKDMLVVYLSGYAMADSEDPRRSYLLVHDSRPEELRETALSFSDIEDFYGRALKATSSVTFLDVARSAPFARAGSATNTLVHQYLSRFASGGARAVLAAADVGQVSWESDAPAADGRGFFARAVLDGLRGAADTNRDGTVTFGEVSAFVRAEVRKSTAGQQIPVAIEENGGTFALAGLKARN